MNKLAAYQNSLWLADPDLFPRYIALATARPCPPRSEVLAHHRDQMRLAAELPELAIPSSGASDPAELAEKGAKSIRAVKGKVGVIPVHGPLEQRTTTELLKAGGTGMDFVAAGLDSLLANDKIGAIVLHIDSPGGSSWGTQELADKIHGNRGQKPIYAMADTLMASAAYWIGSAADMVIATPAASSATVGSIGVLWMHVDESKALEAAGVKVTVVHAAKYKAEKSPFAPLSDEARATVQANVDSIYEAFVGGVKRNRNTTTEDVKKNYGEGRVLSPTQALKVGMIDRIMTFADLIGKLTGGSPGTGGGAEASAAMQARLRLSRGLRERTE